MRIRNFPGSFTNTVIIKKLNDLFQSSLLNGLCFSKVIILQAVNYKIRFSLSYRDVEELPKIRGIKVDHATIQRWVFKFTPLMDQNFRKRKKTVGSRWRLDETYIKVNGKWCYLYGAVDKEAKTIDFL